MRPLRISLVLLLAACGGIVGAQQPSAQKLLADALAKARKENKNVLLTSHASW